MLKCRTVNMYLHRACIAVDSKDVGYDMAWDTVPEINPQDNITGILKS